MKRDITRTQRLARALARRLVRVTAVAALAACGAVAAADDLRDDGSDGDDDDLAALGCAVDRATARVLSGPPDEGDRALLVLVAAREALAIAHAEAPTPEQTADLLQTVGVIEHIASESTTIPWDARLDDPPRARS